MRDDLSLLLDSTHWLGWLGSDPARALRTHLEQALAVQSAGVSLTRVRIVAKPYFLSGGRQESTCFVVTRAAMALLLDLDLEPAGEVRRCAFSWVATGLDAVRRDATYLDGDVAFATVCALLKARIYEVGTGGDAAPGAD